MSSNSEILHHPSKKEQVEVCESKRQRKPSIKRVQLSSTFAHQPVGKHLQAMSSFEHNHCLKILQCVKKHSCAGPFLYAVDTEGLKLHDYFDVVKEPMDLSLIEGNLRSHLYHSQQQFIADMNKIWMNSLHYNYKTSQIYGMTIELKKYFDSLLKRSESAYEPPQIANLKSS